LQTLAPHILSQASIRPSSKSGLYGFQIFVPFWQPHQFLHPQIHSLFIRQLTGTLALLAASFNQLLPGFELIKILEGEIKIDCSANSLFDIITHVVEYRLIPVKYEVRNFLFTATKI